MRERKRLPPTRGLTQLRRALSKRGKGQRVLAEQLDIPQSVISEILNRWRRPTLEQALKFQAIGIQPKAWGEIVADGEAA